MELLQVALNKSKGRTIKEVKKVQDRYDNVRKLEVYFTDGTGLLVYIVNEESIEVDFINKA